MWLGVMSFSVLNIVVLSLCTELDLIAFKLNNIENIFSNHITTVSVTLVGSPKPAQKPIRPALKSGQSSSTVTPQHPRHPLSPSYTPLDDSPGAHPSSILSATLLSLPKTVVGQSSGKFHIFLCRYDLIRVAIV